MSGRERPLPGRYTGIERILTLSDGVFAIAITLLVLNLLVPFATHPGIEEQLGKRWPEYGSYALSFFVIGIIWTNHHQLFTYLKRSNHVFLLINIAFLAWVAFLPFPAAVLAEGFVPGRTLDDLKASVALYAGTFVVGAILFNALWWYAIYNQRLTHDEFERGMASQTTYSYFVGPISYLIAFVFAFWYPWVSLALFFALAVFYALSPSAIGEGVTTRLRSARQARGSSERERDTAGK